MTQVRWKLLRLFLLATCIHIALVITVIGGALAFDLIALKQLSNNQMLGAGVGNIGCVFVLYGWLVEILSDTDVELIQFRKYLGAESGDVGMSHDAKLKYGFPIFFVFWTCMVFSAAFSLR